VQNYPDTFVHSAFIDVSDGIRVLGDGLPDGQVAFQSFRGSAIARENDFCPVCGDLRGTLVDYFRVKLISYRAAFSLIDGNGVAVIREAARFAEENFRDLFSRQASDRALGRYDHYHIGMRSRSKRRHCQKQRKYQAIADCFQ